ncbi:MAG: PQQ-binding-like beta-propeller repeat protein [Phycisphaerae bacterium]|nr:PQQ-binding-like beta-propeller repeat protein [Phycisphaerae bacterium]
MRKMLLVFCLTVFCVTALAEDVAPVTQSGPVSHRFLKTGWNSQSIAIVDKKGNIEWELPMPTCMDAWYLPDNGVIYSRDRKVVRLDADKKEKWTYSFPKGFNHACQPLKDGGFLLGLSVDSDEHYAIELDKNGKETKKVKLELKDCKGHLDHVFRQFRKTSEGTYLGIVMFRNQTCEWDKNGKLIRTFPNGRFVAVRLPNGNTLISGDYKKSKDGTVTGGYLVEYDKKGKVTWELTKKDIDNLKLKISMICGVQVLKNGNIVVTNTRHGAGYGKGDFPHVFEITRDKKKVVWQVNTDKWKNINVIQILDEKGDPHKFELLR